MYSILTSSTTRAPGTPVDGIVAVRCNIILTSGVQIYQFVMSDQTKRIKNEIQRKKNGEETEKENRTKGMRSR